MHNALHILTPITDCKFLYPVQNEWGSTPLTGACIGGNVTTAALLIEKGAQVNYINKVRLLTSLLLEMLCSCTKCVFHAGLNIACTNNSMINDLSMWRSMYTYQIYRKANTPFLKQVVTVT